MFSLALAAFGVVAQTPVEAPRTIRVVMDNAYAPYSFQSDGGKLQGLLIDQWQAWEKKTGIKVEIHAIDWDEALRRMRAGEFDVIDSIVDTAERREYFDFTPAYTPIEASIFFRKDISGITDLASLKGFPVGVKAGDQHIDRLKEHGVTTVILFENNEAIIAAAKQHKINVFVVDDPSALYLLHKAGIEGDFRHSAPIFRDQLRRAVRKGDAAMLRRVSEGFAAIDAGELSEIDEKWFGRSINSYGHYLTYAGYAATVAILLIAGLIAWNSTLRKRILQRTAALGESEERFRQIAENIHEVFWLSTADLSNALYVSPAYESVWGRSRESLYQDQRSFFTAIHRDDRSRVSTIIERDREQGFEVEYRVVRPDGSFRWIWDRGFPIRDESGRFYRLAGIAEDITERKHTEALLHAKEQEFRAIVENAPDQIIRYDREFRRTYVNPAVAKVYGLPAEALVGKPIGSAIQDTNLAVKDDELAQVRQRIAAVFETGQSCEYELNWPTPAGRRYYSVRLFPELEFNGEVVNVLGISRDITARKLAEDALRRSEDRIRLIINTIPINAWTVRPDGAVDFVNQRLLEYSGLSLEQFIGEPNLPIHPEDVSKVVKQWAANMSAEKSFESEIRLRRADGEYRWFLVRTVPLRDEHGNLVKWYGVSTDIEDLKRTEEQLKHSESQLAEAQGLAHIGSWDWDLRSNAVTWSEELYRIFGLPPGSIAVAGDEMQFIHPEDRDFVMSTVKRLVKRKEPSSYYYRVLRPDGDERIVHSRGHAVSDEDGNPMRVFGAAEDVTELKRAEDKLKSTTEQLRALSARLQSAREEEGTRIAREIHDELGSVLTSLKWDLEGTDRILAGPMEASQIAALRERLHASTALTDVAISAIRRIASELRPSVLDDLGLAAAIEWQAQQFEARTGITCVCDCVLESVELSQEQATAVFRILQEALTNVLRHAQATRVEIKINNENGYFILSVSDNGKGITESEKSEQQSLGILGMRERAHLIGGEIDITGVEKKGTVVVVRVPLPGLGKVLMMTRQGVN